jgi:hypothetical protein
MPLPLHHQGGDRLIKPKNNFKAFTRLSDVPPKAIGEIGVGVEVTKLKSAVGEFG